MDSRTEFDQIYERIAGSRPLYAILVELSTGIPRWRLSIYERDAAATGGDKEHLCIEARSEEECLRRGAAGLKRLFD